MKNIKEVIVLMCCLSLIFPTPIAFAAPQGGKVVGGSANIHQSGTTTTINQSSDRAIINWHSFDIGKNEAVRHNMPSTKSAGLHRVVGGGGASQIQGLLQSNGNIYLVNPAGVVIHKGARVDTNSFIATTRDIADSNFMKGKMVFDRPGHPGAQIINQGTISVKESGLAALVAPTVRNEGLIAGKLGKVALASGDSTWKLDMHGDDLITFTVNENDVNALHATDGTPLAGAGVENSGSIKAEGGVVVLTAAQLDGIVGSVVNSGEVSAASAEVKGGKITFRGEGSHVDVRNTGIVDASSAKADGGAVRMVADGAVASSGAVAATGGQKGGKAVLTGRHVALTGQACIDVSGATGGGTALVGGNALGKGPERNAKTARVESEAAIHADAKVKGDGGQVVVWSDEKTRFDGIITARGGSEGDNGGQVETSGKSLKVGDTARVDTSAKKGVHGQWLLDPVDFTIAASGGDMTGATLSENLEKSDVHIKSDFLSGISINDSILWHADTTLTLEASSYQSYTYPVSVNANITMYGDNAGLIIYPILELNGAKINIYGDNPVLRIGGENFKVLNNIYDLQNIKLDTSHDANYALGSNIDASKTSKWNDGKGFEPINMFEGKLNGLGHNIINITINRPYEDYVGLFRKTPDWAQIRSLNLVDCKIYGGNYVGAFAGSFSGTTWGSTGYGDGDMTNVSCTGTVSGKLYVGGLVGYNRGSIIESYNSANIFGNEYIGGIAGVNDTEIKRTYNTGNVTGNNYVGGIVGTNNKESYWVYIVPKISNSYNIGKVVGDADKVGGFYGKNNGELERCFWDITTSQQEKINSLGCQGYDTEKMIEVISTDAWDGFEDFENYWTFTRNSPYPALIAFVSKYPGIIPGPTPNPDPGPTPNPSPAPVPTPDPDDMHISQIIRYTKDEQKLIDGVDLYVVELLPNSLQDEQNLSEGTQEKQKDLNDFRKTGQNAINSIKEKIGKDLYEKINLKNSSEETALANVKKQIKFTHTMIGESNLTIPNGLYEAFAKSIIDSIGGSKIDKLSTNQNKLINQIGSAIHGGFKNYSNQLEIDGIIYYIKSSTRILEGAGLASCTISWVGKNGKHFSGTLVWASTPEEGLKALSEYCVALNELHKDAWKEAASYVLTGKPNSKKYFDIGDKFIKAIGDKKYAKELGKEIGKAFVKEFTGGFLKNKMETFIEKNIPNGSDIIGAAKAIKNIEEKYNDINKLINQSKDYSKEKGDLLSACELLMSHYNYAANELVELEQALGL